MIQKRIQNSLLKKTAAVVSLALSDVKLDVRYASVIISLLFSHFSLPEPEQIDSDGDTSSPAPSWCSAALQHARWCRVLRSSTDCTSWMKDCMQVRVPGCSNWCRTFLLDLWFSRFLWRFRILHIFFRWKRSYGCRILVSIQVRLCQHIPWFHSLRCQMWSFQNTSYSWTSSVHPMDKVFLLDNYTFCHSLQIPQLRSFGYVMRQSTS